ncbi:hypothetical protein [Sphingobacterium sp. T2]|uniref:hypothetical protein n=1 Tax=Sphingobacterium sp. T2 TaxID=1590596 RepID=UPI00057B8237|nr:hypothetical protein [Sphingobacterium sp. T2]
MKRLVEIIVYSFVLSVFIACSSEEKKQEEVQKKQAELDSIALIYDPAQADKRIDEFMQRLHKRSGLQW